MAKRRISLYRTIGIQSAKQDIKETKRAIAKETDPFKRRLLLIDLETFEYTLSVLEGGAR